MKLLVLAQTPPPLHGQSLMVQTLVAGLPAQGIELRHIDLRLSHDTSDIGRWRVGKFWATLAAAIQAVYTRLRHGCDTLYYVPAPAKRGALYRDWLVMLICRPFFPRLVLHWHATGLTSWLELTASPVERWITHLLLGRADLSIVLAAALRADADNLHARRVAIVPNGIADPGPPARSPVRPSGRQCEILFLGLGSRSKGLFDTLDGVALANQRAPGAFHLTVAGGFASADEQLEFEESAKQLGPAVRHVGFADELRKKALFSSADVFCFPTSYPHEGQPLVLLEAMAHDLPVITTRWRAIPETAAPTGTFFVSPGEPDQIAAHLAAIRRQPPPAGEPRAHYLTHFTREAHLRRLADQLRAL